MRKYFYRIVFLLVLWCSSAAGGCAFGAGALVPPVLAESITSTQLIENAKQYDNQTITFQGEVIGDVMKRGDFAWVNINDGTNALGIWMSKDFTKDIVYTGSYKAKGDILEVEGIFHRACPQHGGDMDIHAQVVKKIQSGQTVSETIDSNKRNIALILLGVLCLVLILQVLKKK